MKRSAPSLAGCFYCGVPGYKGCAHYGPADPPVINRPPDGLGIAKHRLTERGARKRGYETSSPAGERAARAGKYH